MAVKKSYKKERMELQIMEDVNSILRTKFSDPRVQFVTVTKVELNDDFSVAKVYWDSFDSSKRGDAKKAMSGLQTKIRSALAGMLQVRHTPQIIMIYDSQYESENSITEILKQEAAQGKTSGSHE